MTIKYKKIIDIDNRRLINNNSRYSAPSLIFIAGLGDSYETWKKVQDQISQKTSTFSYNRTGIGRSQVASVPTTCYDLVEKLNEWLLELEVEKPYILVGHSFG